jgi:hypothetical protein
MRKIKPRLSKVIKITFLVPFTFVLPCILFAETSHLPIPLVPPSILLTTSSHLQLTRLKKSSFQTLSTCWHSLTIPESIQIKITGNKKTLSALPKPWKQWPSLEPWRKCGFEHITLAMHPDSQEEGQASTCTLTEEQEHTGTYNTGATVPSLARAFLLWTCVSDFAELCPALSSCSSEHLVADTVTFRGPYFSWREASLSWKATKP